MPRRRARENAGQRTRATAVPLSPIGDGEVMASGTGGVGGTLTGATEGRPAEMAREMLVALQRDGFEAFSAGNEPGTPLPTPSRHARSASAAGRRSRLRAGVTELTEEALQGGGSTEGSEGVRSARSGSLGSIPFGYGDGDGDGDGLRVGLLRTPTDVGLFDLGSPTEDKRTSS